MDVLRSTEVTESLNTSTPHNAYADNAQFRIKAWKTTKKAVSSDMLFWYNEHFLTHTNSIHVYLSTIALYVGCRTKVRQIIVTTLNR